MHEWPRLELVRRPKSDGAKYLGPYHSRDRGAPHASPRGEAFSAPHLLRSRDGEPQAALLEVPDQALSRPCVYDVDKELYGQQVNAVALFLQGRHDELSAELQNRMQEASAKFEFELAAIYRDQLHAVTSVREAQTVVAHTEGDQDVVGIYREGDLVELAVMLVRSGRVVDIASFSTRHVEIPDDEVVATFLREHYAEGGPGAAHIPDEVLVPTCPTAPTVSPSGSPSDARQPRPRRAGEPRCSSTRRSAVHAATLLELALSNARHAFEEKRRAEDDIDERLARVQERLRLPTLPRRIECSDISHLGGRDTVGAVVALLNGMPDKKRYRTYNVKGVAEGDDYGAMYQVLSRRFRRGKLAAEAAESKPGECAGRRLEGDRTNPLRGWMTPGRCRTSSSSTVVAASSPWRSRRRTISASTISAWSDSPRSARVRSAKSWSIASISRGRRIRSRSAPTARSSSCSRALATRPIASRTGEGSRSASDAASSRPRSGEGIGPKSRSALLQAFGSIHAIRDASDEALLGVAGVTKRQVAALRKFFADQLEAQEGDSADESLEEEEGEVDESAPPSGVPESEESSNPGPSSGESSAEQPLPDSR